VGVFFLEVKSMLEEEEWEWEEYDDEEEDW
jgi:hypothetical protein